MMKLLILKGLLLGVIFAQIIPAYTLDSEDDEIGDSDLDELEDSEGEISEEEYDVSLTCTLFGNLGCNTECSIKGMAFSTKSSGQCIDNNVCECTLDENSTLDDLFRAAFDNETALEKIKKNKLLVPKVLDILKTPFQPPQLIKEQLKEVVCPSIYNVRKLRINVKTPASMLVGKTANDLIQNRIRHFVITKLKPILRANGEQLKNIDYKSNLSNTLKNNSAEDLPTITADIRRTKNEKLISIVDDYVNSNKIKEQENSEKPSLADAISYLVVDQLINYIDQKKPTNKPASLPVEENNGKQTRSLENFSKPKPFSCNKIRMIGTKTNNDDQNLEKIPLIKKIDLLSNRLKQDIREKYYPDKVLTAIEKQKESEAVAKFRENKDDIIGLVNILVPKDKTDPLIAKITLHEFKKYILAGDPASVNKRYSKKEEEEMVKGFFRYEEANAW